MEIGQIIKRARIHAGLTQEALGARAGGWEQARVSHYERGRRPPDWNDIVAICNALGLTPLELLERYGGAERSARGKGDAPATVIERRLGHVSKRGLDALLVLLDEIQASRKA